MAGPHGDPEQDAADPQTTTIEQWEAEGWSGTFRVVAGGRVACGQCGGDHPAADVQVDRLGRHEGLTNPEDEELLLALTCRTCGHRGTLTVAYGPYASAEEAEVVQLLPDARPRR